MSVAQVNVNTALPLLANGQQNAGGDTLGGQYVTELLPPRAALARAGYLFTLQVSAVATSLPSTSTVGTFLWNPPGSGVQLFLLDWTSQIVATSATCTGIGLATGFQTTTPTSITAATSAGNTIAQGVTRTPDATTVTASVATVLTAPILVHTLHHNTAAINTVGMEEITGDLKGAFMLPEGGFAHLCALGAAAAASGHTSSLMYARIPTR